jgi:FHS family L-fucose permease-like MFS transporter
MQASKNTYLVPFALVCSLFFLWGIANSLNGSLIRHFQFALDLERWQAGIVDSAFYFGYFVMALPAGYFMRRYGYKLGILSGLILYAVGAFLFYPAADFRVYGFFLFALFTIAAGLAFLETAANLYVTVLGDREGAAWRINFAQSFNGISIILGPVIGSLFIFSNKSYSEAVVQSMAPAELEAARVSEALSVQGPYIVVGVVVLLVAALFAITRMPEVGREEENLEGAVGIMDVWKRYAGLRWGVLAQFANVGAQATLWGYFVDFKMDFAPSEHWGIVTAIYGLGEGLTLEQVAGFHASFALVLFMMGRFLGTFLMSRMDAKRVLGWYSLAAVVLVVLAGLLGGLIGVGCLMLTYFCQSIMFPTIFALSTRGLPPAEQKLASSLVIMGIVGGAVLPPLAGLLTGLGGMQYALAIPFACFFYVWQYVRGTIAGKFINQNN